MTTYVMNNFNLTKSSFLKLLLFGKMQKFIILTVDARTDKKITLLSFVFNKHALHFESKFDDINRLQCRNNDNFMCTKNALKS